MSPTQRTLAKLRADGLAAYVVERWNPFARKRQDMFGIIDIVAIGSEPKQIVGVQCTSDTNVSAHCLKLKASPYSKLWKDAGGILQVWGWGKHGPKGKRKTWSVRIVDM